MKEKILGIVPGEVKDFDFKVICDTVDKMLKEYPDRRFYQKFTCDGCGVRQTMAVANVFYKHGKCQECDFITNIERNGCNYLMLVTNDTENLPELDKIIKESFK